jgi:hypothetical protein
VRETPLQRRIQRALRKEFREAFVRKIHVSDFQSTGIPDLLVVIHGYVFLFEVKPPKKYPTPLQLDVMRKARRAGAISCVIRSPADACAIVRHTLYVRGVLARPERSWLERLQRAYIE